MRFFFKQYAAPLTKAFVWPSFHSSLCTDVPPRLYTGFFILTILRKDSINETAAWLAQLAGRRSAGRLEVAGSNPGRTNTMPGL